MISAARAISTARMREPAKSFSDGDHEMHLSLLSGNIWD